MDTKASGDLESIFLIDDELMSLRALKYFVCHVTLMLKKGVETYALSPLGTKLLDDEVKITGSLDETGRFGQEDRRVTDFDEENGVNFWMMVEMLEGAHSLGLHSNIMNIDFPKLLRTLLREISEAQMRRFSQQSPLVGLKGATPLAMHDCNMVLCREVHIFLFKQLRPDHKLGIGNLVVFANECRSQAKFCVDLSGDHDAVEYKCRNDIDLVEQNEFPLASLKKFHRLLGSMSPIVRVGHH